MSDRAYTWPWSPFFFFCKQSATCLYTGTKLFTWDNGDFRLLTTEQCLPDLSLVRCHCIAFHCKRLLWHHIPYKSCNQANPEYSDNSLTHIHTFWLFGLAPQEPCICLAHNWKKTLINNLETSSSTLNGILYNQQLNESLYFTIKRSCV